MFICAAIFKKRTSRATTQTLFQQVLFSLNPELISGNADTQKNIVYVLAKTELKAGKSIGIFVVRMIFRIHLIVTVCAFPEQFAVALCRHFLKEYKQVADVSAASVFHPFHCAFPFRHTVMACHLQVQIDCRQQNWVRMVDPKVKTSFSFVSSIENTH